MIMGSPDFEGKICEDTKFKVEFNEDGFTLWLEQYNEYDDRIEKMIFYKGDSLEIVKVILKSLSLNVDWLNTLYNKQLEK